MFQGENSVKTIIADRKARKLGRRPALRERPAHPCCIGSALRQYGVDGRFAAAVETATV